MTPFRNQAIAISLFCVLLPPTRLFAFVDGFLMPGSHNSANQYTTVATISRLHVSYPPPSRSSSASSILGDGPKSELTYVPQSELDQAIRREQKRHEQECQELQTTITHQKQELQRLQESERKERLKHKMYHDACSWSENNNSLQMLWSENHTEKMLRFQGRLEYLTSENAHLLHKLEDEKARHALEVQQLQVQLVQEKENTQEAKDVLGLERAYYETSVKLLEAGLERQGCKVKELQATLKAQKERIERRQGRRQEEPLPQRNVQYHQTFEQLQQPLRRQHQPQTFETRSQQQELQQPQQDSQDPQQFRVYRHHENQYFEQLQHEQQQEEYEHRRRHQEVHVQEQHEYLSDQFGFENAHYSNLQDQQQRQQQQQRTQRYQPPQQQPQYYDRRSTATVNEDRYKRVAHTRKRPHARTAIPTMNGPNLGGGGINDMRNRLY